MLHGILTTLQHSLSVRYREEMSAPSDRMRSNFAYFDKNSDDFITISEELGSFRRGWASQYDTDGDGRLSFSEFLATAPSTGRTAGSVSGRTTTTTAKTSAPTYKTRPPSTGLIVPKLPAQPDVPKVSQSPVASIPPIPSPRVTPSPKQDTKASPTQTAAPPATVSPPKGAATIPPPASVSPPAAQGEKTATRTPVLGNIDPSRPDQTAPAPLVPGNIDPSKLGQTLIAPFSDSKPAQQKIVVGDGDTSVLIGDATTSNKQATLPTTQTNPEPDFDLYGDGTRRFDPVPVDDFDLYDDGTRRFDPIEQASAVGQKPASFTRANYVD